MKVTLKPYHLKVHAIKITRKNFQELKKLDTGDGVLEEGDIDDFLGDWFVVMDNGNQIWPGSETLTPC